MLRYRIAIASGVLLVLLAAGCAGTNPLQGTNGANGVAGFWAGLWHGLICPFTFVLSLFNHGFRMYEVHNNGTWYDLGFLIGASSSLGSAGHGTARRGKG
jgi:polyferredoxin